MRMAAISHGHVRTATCLNDVDGRYVDGVRLRDEPSAPEAARCWPGPAGQWLERPVPAASRLAVSQGISPPSLAAPRDSQAGAR